jgi:uncharacterized protein (TIGR01777 family)
MHVAITGATGLIGGALSSALRADGHRVTGVTRSAPGPEEIRWSPAEGRLDPDALRDVDAVVNLAGEPIGFSSLSPAAIARARWSPERKRRILDSRVQGTTLLARTMADLDDGPRTLVSASAIGYYGNVGARELTEDSPPGDLFLSDVCRRWEAAADPARDAGIRVVHPRIGLVQSPRGGALAQSLLLFRTGLGGPFGDGSDWWSWVMLDDVIGVLRHALETDGVSGPLNVTAPTPVTNAAWAKALGHALGRPAVVPIPRFGPRLVFGRQMADELVFSDARVLPEATLASGYRYRVTDLEAGLRSALDA